MIKFSAPGKIHLLGEHAVVYGKPALLAAVDLRVYVTIAKGHSTPHPLKKMIEPIIKKGLNIKTMPLYNLTISSQIPIGSGLGSSAAIAASYIAALLTFLQVKWDLNLINNLTYEAEKTFQGNPSGGDNSTVVYGGLIWFRKETPDLKIIHPLNFTTPYKLAKNFVLINTGEPKEITAEMVKLVKQLYDKKPKIVNEFLEQQESLVRQLLSALKTGNAALMLNIIRAGERNLESIGVVPKKVVSMIRKIETSGGAAKISGAGGKKGAAGMLLAYHPDRNKLIKVIKSYNLPFFTAKLGVEGLRQE